MRLNLRSRATLQVFLSEARLLVAMGSALRAWHVITFHVKRTHTATAVRNVYDLLTQRQIVTCQRVHIHSMCEYLSRRKEC
jgi:hypothetical protein